MANNNPPPRNNTPGSNAPVVRLHRQYIKDMEFINYAMPNLNMDEITETPSITVNLSVNAENITGEMHEIKMVITTDGRLSQSNQDLFSLKFTYAGIFEVSNVEDMEKEMILLIYCPGVLFPFARRIVADATRDGGMPPLMIDVVDFAKLYKDRKVESMAEDAGREVASWSNPQPEQPKQRQRTNLSAPDPDNNDIFES